LFLLAGQPRSRLLRIECRHHDFVAIPDGPLHPSVTLIGGCSASGAQAGWIQSGATAWVASASSLLDEQAGMIAIASAAIDVAVRRTIDKRVALGNNISSK
jgi:hypothetical protein